MDASIGRKRSILKNVSTPAASDTPETPEELQARIRALEAQNVLLREDADAAEELQERIHSLEAENKQLLQRIQMLEKMVDKDQANPDTEQNPEDSEMDPVSGQDSFRPLGGGMAMGRTKALERDNHTSAFRKGDASCHADESSGPPGSESDTWASWAFGGSKTEPPIYFRSPSGERSHWFSFMKADRIREWGRSDGAFPRHQDIRPTWFVAHEISLVGIFRLTYERKFLVVSHRWLSEKQPDPSCTQLMLVRRYLLANPQVEYVWYDYWCLPQVSWHEEEQAEEKRQRLRVESFKAGAGLFQRPVVPVGPKKMVKPSIKRESFMTDEEWEEAWEEACRERELAFARAMKNWRSARDRVKKFLQHREAEWKYVKRSARFMWCLYVSMTVLIIQDKESPFRFWCCLEMWLAMQSGTKNGLVMNPAYLPQRDIVVDESSVYNSQHTPVAGGLLRNRLADKDLPEVKRFLRQASLKVTIERDREFQLGVLDRLDREAKQSYQWFKKRNDRMLQQADEYVFNLWQTASRKLLFLPCRGETLDLSQRNIDDDMASVVAEEVESNTTLRTLALGRNRITDVGAKHLARALACNKTLEMLYLNKNLISDAGAEQLVSAAMQNQSLGRLDIENNRLTKEGKEKLHLMVSRDMLPSFRLRD